MSELFNRRLFPICLCAIAMLMALSVMLGWFIQSTSLTQPLNNFAPMQFNTALSLFLAASAWICAIKNWVKPLLSLGIALLILTGFTFLQYLSGANFGIDTLFIEPFNTAHSPHPGRMAPNTAISFFALGLAALPYRRNKFIWQTSIILCACTLGLALIAFFGYATDLVPAIGWASHTHMAIHTATGAFFVASAGIVAQFQTKYIPQYLNRWILCTAIPVAATFNLCVYFAVTVQDQRSQASKLSIQAEYIAQRMRVDFNHLANSIDHLAELQLAQTNNKDTWLKEAQLYFDEFDYLDLLVALDQDSSLLWSIPEQSHGAFKQRAPQDTLEKIHAQARQMQHLSLIHFSYGLDQVEHSQDKLWLGKIERHQNSSYLHAALVSLSAYIQSILPALPSAEYSLRLYDHNNKVIYDGYQTPSDFQSVSTNVDLAALKSLWRLELSASPSYWQNKQSPWKKLALIFTTLFCASLIYLAHQLAQVSFQRTQNSNLLQRQKSTLNAMQDGLIVIDKKGIISDLNDYTCELFGYKSEELIGRNVSMLMPRDVAQQHNDFLAAAAPNKKFIFIGEQRSLQGKRKDGLPFPINLKVSQYLFNGETYFTGIIRDLTDLQESEERYKLAVQGAGVGIWDWFDIQQDKTYWSDRFYKLLGYAPEETKAGATAFRRLLHPEDLETVDRAFAQHFNLHREFNLEFRLLCRNGQYRWFRANGQAAYDDNGKARRMVGSLEDIQDRKDLEIERLRTLEVIESSSDFICQLDPYSNEVIYANYAFQKACPNYKIASSKQLPWHRPEDFSQLQDNLSSLKNQSQYQGEINFEHQHNGSLICSILILAHHNQDGELQYYSLVYRDISELKHKEAELERSNVELEQFAYIASHDLKEPLRNIQAFSAFLLKDIESNKPDKIARDIDFITSSTQRMQVLIQDLLSLSRAGQQKLELESVDLGELLNSVQQQIAIRIKETDTTIEVEPNLPTINGDTGSLHQVFSNLIANSIKFREKSRPCLIKIYLNSKQEQSEYIEIAIEDNGIGIDEKHHTSIFQSFHRLHAKSKYEGSGLGLSIVSRIIGRHGGSVRLESELDKGSTFYVRLPKQLNIENPEENPNAT